MIKTPRELVEDLQVGVATNRIQTGASARQRLLHVVQLGAAIALIASVVLVWRANAEAMEERAVATAASSLRVAAMTVATAEALHGAGEAGSTPQLDEAVEQLNSDHGLALHALTPAEQDRTLRLIGEMLGCGVALLSGEHPGDTHDNAELQSLLGLAASRASDDARTADQAARLAAGAAISVAVLAAFLVMRARSSAQRERAATSAQIDAGLRIQALLNDVPEVVVVIDSAGAITYNSASLNRTFGPGTIGSASDLIARAIPSDRRNLELHLFRGGSIRRSRSFQVAVAPDRVRHFDVRVSDLSDDALVGGHLVTARDITHEVALQNSLEHQAFVDELTGLPNRRALGPELDRAAEVVRLDNGVSALMMLDLDGFKATNDSLGHGAGDQLLKMVTARLVDVLRSDATMLRLGGDEFALVVAGAADVHAVDAIAERLLDSMLVPFQVEERAESLRTSIGIAILDDPDQVDEMLGMADTALYEAKRRGGAMAVVFEEYMSQEAESFNAMGRALRNADFDREFRLVYQPVVNTATGRVESVEALLRWDSPALGPISPADFIPVAEQSGVICDIGRWVLTNAIKQVADWDRTGDCAGLSVAVNVSPRQINEPTFPDGVLDLLGHHDFDPTRLILEVTETAMMAEGDTGPQRIAGLRDAGIRVAIDDFGSGYSNLEQLLTLPFDVLKIDRSLLVMLGEMRAQTQCAPGEPCAILGAIVSIASALGAPIIAEGVESEAQLMNLRASGVSLVQGFLLARPESPERVVEQIRRIHDDRAGGLVGVRL